mmetsp:Transcript_2216/g.3518  ORF Transcript_2216/g.3518 Transcript_2216/m.3518 type:complete len:249 (-) Transcript_2216:229-975(-)
MSNIPIIHQRINLPRSHSGTLETSRITAHIGNYPLIQYQSEGIAKIVRCLTFGIDLTSISIAKQKSGDELRFGVSITAAQVEHYLNFKSFIIILIITISAIAIVVVVANPITKQRKALFIMRMTIIIYGDYGLFINIDMLAAITMRTKYTVNNGNGCTRTARKTALTRWGRHCNIAASLPTRIGASVVAPLPSSCTKFFGAKYRVQNILQILIVLLQLHIRILFFLCAIIIITVVVVVFVVVFRNDFG